MKARKEPLDKHYYDVDHKYNGITGEGSDDTREISKEEFYGKDRE